MRCADHQPGEAKLGYVQWHDRAHAAARKGERQRRCGECERWFFPWEMAGEKPAAAIARMGEIKRGAEEQDRDPTSEEDREIGTLERRIAEAVRVELPRLACCEDARRNPAAVWVTFDDADGGEVVPRWTMSVPTLEHRLRKGDAPGRSEVPPPPRYCPFCARPLPRIVWRAAPPAPLCRVTDGGYYCDTCGERCDGCTCFPITCAFELAEAGA